ncbi:FkbM family methyltransferase [Shimia sediminis]|uniref:FkbM family methyltransferase n=1 Tax=Shimia sediminis TaxID=2497945 RepID=UPI0013E03EA5|nr:FkbM family methyltransferase [Shimia sediminis]
MVGTFENDRVAALIDMLKPERLTRIVDVGANPVNDPPYKALLEMGSCEVWGFEPHPEAFEALQNVENPNVHYLPFAVGAGGKATLNICNSSAFTSLLEPNSKAVTYLGMWGHAMTVAEKVEMDTKRLDDLDDIPAFDLLKIDVQGGEGLVFQGAQEKLAASVAVITEVAAIPLYVDQPLLDEQMRLLRQTGHHLHKFQSFKSRKLHRRISKTIEGRALSNQLIDGDAVFVRDMMDLQLMSDEELKHLAILADAVIESYDLSIAAMQELIIRGHLKGRDVKQYIEHVIKIPRVRTR